MSGIGDLLDPVDHHFSGSSRVDWCRYDARKRILTVTFLNGVVYRYRGVPPPIFQSFTTAASPGRFVTDELDLYHHNEV